MASRIVFLVLFVLILEVAFALDVVRLSALKRCSVDLSEKFSGDFDFVCDKMTGGWYHYDGSTWAPASAGSGGCHTYVALKGTKPDCTVNQACAACESPTGEVVGSFFLEKDGCKEPSSCR